MAFIGLFILNIILFLVVISTTISFFLFVTAIIILLINKKNKNNKKQHKVAFNVILIFSILFLIPLFLTTFGFISIDTRITREKQEEINKLENKIYIKENTIKESIIYNNNKLVPIYLFSNTKTFNKKYIQDNLIEVANLVIKEKKDYSKLYKIPNNSNYNIYYIGNFNSQIDLDSRIYAEEKNINKIINYYSNTEFKIDALWLTAPSYLNINNKIINTNINYKDNKKIVELSKEVFNDSKNNKKEEYIDDNGKDEIIINLYTEDNIYEINLEIYIKDNSYELYLNDYKVEEKLKNKYKEVIYNLVEQVEYNLTLN